LNLVQAAPLWLLIIFGCALAAAAVEDSLRLRISNLTSIVVLAGAIVAAAVEGPSWTLWQNGSVFLILLVLGTIAFSAGWLGGGDVKLFAATGLWFDLRSALWLIALIFIAGGVVAIIFFVTRLLRGGGLQASRKARIPYGVAIAVGTLALILLDARAMSHRERALPSVSAVPPRS